MTEDNEMTQVNFKLTKRELKILDAQVPLGMTRSSFLRQLFTEKEAEERIQQEQPIAIDLSKLDQLDAKFNTFQDKQEKRARELQRLLETFTNVVLDMREANRSMHENTTQAINLTIQQNTNVVATLTSLHAQFERLIKRIEELKK